MRFLQFIAGDEIMKSTLALVAFTLLAAPTLAQTHAHGAHNGQSPYAGLEQRQIKALSDEQIADLLAGRGMSLALPAELNGYPGPSHVLELAEPLELTHHQRARTQALLSEMKRGAAALGARIIESERLLDALFAGDVAATQTVTAATAETALLQGQLRALHLQYHLDMRHLLTAKQVRRYNDLRGYGGARVRRMEAASIRAD
jgi:hypothetical protein